MSSPDPSARPPQSAEQNLAALLQARLPPRAFWGQFLPLLVRGLRAEAGALWWLQPDGDRLAIIAMGGRTELETALAQRPAAQSSHVLQAVATSRTAVTSFTESAEPPQDGLAGRILLAHPVLEQRRVVGALELVLPGTLSSSDLQQRVQGLERAIRQAIEGRAGRAAPPTGAADDDGRGRQRLTERLYRSLVVREVADVAVNDGRALLGCDRVSLALRRGGAVNIIAVSGQDQVNGRSEQIRSLAQLARDAMEFGHMLDFQESADRLAPHVRDRLADYVEQSGSRQVLAIPLRPPPPADSATSPEETAGSREGPVFGCLLIEQFHESESTPRRQPGLTELGNHVAAALNNALDHEQIWLVPTRRRLGKLLNFFRGRRLAVAATVMAGLFTVMLALLLIPGDYRIEAEGRLMPSEQRRVFAPWDGIVAEIPVRDGQSVRQGDTLLRLVNDELHAELVTTRNELAEQRQALLSLDAQILTSAQSGDRTSELRLRGQREEIRVDIAGLQDRLVILEDRETSLTLTAPIDGVVVGFQLQEELDNRPVSRGELLLEVMDDDSPRWRLELQIPEQRMGHLLQALADRDDTGLPVEYVLATAADRTYPARLLRRAVATRSELGRDSEAVVEVYADIEPGQLTTPRIAAEVTGKINCGRKSLAYILFGDVWEFLQRFFWL